MKRIVPFALLSLVITPFIATQGLADDSKGRSSGSEGKTIVELAVSKEAEVETNKAFDIVKPKERSMFHGMTILASSGQWTIVPKSAILAMPRAMKFHVLEQPDGEYVQWPEFSRLNRGWLISREVSIETIKGQDPFSEKEVKGFERSSKVVVATYNNSPVSVISTSK